MQDSQIGIRNHGKTESRLAEKTKAWCTEISKGKRSYYQLPWQDISRSPTNQIATVQVGPRGARLTGSPGKVLMVVGGTGAGKTTLINAMVNYLFGVEWEDDFRFAMIEEAAKDQTKSVTKWITAYTIPAQEGSPVPYTLTIIDTPGFGNTEGVEQDKRIAQQVKELFSKKGQGGIDQLHGIGFVVQSALGRLTHTQRYMFDSILAIFGKDVEKNVFMMTTFADGQRPPVLDVAREANVSYGNYFKFNNSALYSDDKTSDYDRMYWELGRRSMRKFFTYFGEMTPTSILLTKEVIEERERLEVLVQGLQGNLRIKEAHRCIERLDEIALRPNPMGKVEYINLQIESEKEQRKTGFIKRISILEKLRDQAELISKLHKQKGTITSGATQLNWWKFWNT